MKNYQIFFRNFGTTHKGIRIDKALSQIFIEYSRTKIKSWIIRGLIEIDGKIEKNPSKRLNGKEKIIKLYKNFKENNSIYFFPQNITLDIVYEDEEIIILNKSSNFVVHPGIKNSINTVLNALIYHYPFLVQIPRAGIIHRLDKDTTGLMIIAKTINARDYLISLLKKKKIIREYEAIVWGNIPDNNGIISKPIGRSKIIRTRMSVSNYGKPAITKYHVVSRFLFHTWVRLRLYTGRTHQIRVHMSAIKNPIVGDPIYGKKKLKSFFSKINSLELKNILINMKRQALHANFLSFRHPKNLKKMSWKIPLPKDISDLLEFLKKNQFSSIEK